MTGNRAQARCSGEATSTDGGDKRFHALDGMRGLAALSVVVYHFNQPSPEFFAHGYLAVDFFFILSGFVIAHAYTARLTKGLSFGRFMLLRLIRLYPLVAAGIALGVVRLAAAWAADDPDALLPSTLGVSLLFNALMLPTPSAVKSLFPLNNPMWSLFFEVVLNAAFALFLFRWRTEALVALTGVLAAGVAYGSYHAGTLNIGWSHDDMAWGFVRAGFGITMGLVMHHLLKGRVRSTSSAPVVLSVLLVLALAFPHLPSSDWAIDLAILFILAPAAIFAGVIHEIPFALRKTYGLLGDLSYPLYCIHFPLISAIKFIGSKVRLGTPVIFVIYMIMVIALSALLLKFWDFPVRHRLNRLIRTRASAPPQELA